MFWINLTTLWRHKTKNNQNKIITYLTFKRDLQQHHKRKNSTWKCSPIIMIVVKHLWSKIPFAANVNKRQHATNIYCMGTKHCCLAPVQKQIYLYICLCLKTWEFYNYLFIYLFIWISRKYRKQWNFKIQ